LSPNYVTLTGSCGGITESIIKQFTDYNYNYMSQLLRALCEAMYLTYVIFPYADYTYFIK